MAFWAQRDPQAAADWMKALPEGVARDTAVQAYVGFVGGHSPERAAPLINEIKTPQIRHAHIESLAQTWLKLDKNAASTWLGSTDLPEARKKELLNR
jgi:hypothetical protein